MAGHRLGGYHTGVVVHRLHGSACRDRSASSGTPCSAIRSPSGRRTGCLSDRLLPPRWLLTSSRWPHLCPGCHHRCAGSRVKWSAQSDPGPEGRRPLQYRKLGRRIIPTNSGTPCAHHSRLYSLYLLYLRLPSVMKAPREKAMAYTALVIVAAIVLFMVLAMIASRFRAVPTAGMTVPERCAVRVLHEGDADHSPRHLSGLV